MRFLCSTLDVTIYVSSIIACHVFNLFSILKSGHFLRNNIKSCDWWNVMWNTENLTEDFFFSIYSISRNFFFFFFFTFLVFMVNVDFVQGACVQAVLDSIVPALLADKNRKFIFVEQAINAFLSLKLLLIGFSYN